MITTELWYLSQVLKGGKAGQATLALPADEDKLQAAAQLIIGAHAIYDGSVIAISGSQVTPFPALMAFIHHSHLRFTGLQQALILKQCKGNIHRQNTFTSPLFINTEQPSSKSFGCGHPGGSCRNLTVYTTSDDKVITNRLLC